MIGFQLSVDTAIDQMLKLHWGNILTGQGATSAIAHCRGRCGVNENVQG
jgi:hypothetical protein